MSNIHRVHSPREERILEENPMMRMSEVFNDPNIKYEGYEGKVVDGDFCGCYA